jgi:hypothetical protein
MVLTLRIAALLGLSVALGFGENWSGSLIDSKCYASRERNVNPTDTLTNVDRDGSEEIRFCSPSPRTKSFALVLYDGRSFSLDSPGNTKASELVRSSRKRQSPLSVAITGEIVGQAIRADSISAAPQH